MVGTLTAGFVTGGGRCSEAHKGGGGGGGRGRGVFPEPYTIGMGLWVAGVVHCSRGNVDSHLFQGNCELCGRDADARKLLHVEMLRFEHPTFKMGILAPSRRSPASSGRSVPCFLQFEHSPDA